MSPGEQWRDSNKEYTDLLATYPVCLALISLFDNAIEGVIFHFPDLRTQDLEAT